MKPLRRAALGLGLLLVVACLPKTIPPLPPQPAKVAVVLGAGVSRGFAHVGVLKVLEAHKVPIHLIVGTSAGSIVGSIYANKKKRLTVEAQRDLPGLRRPFSGRPAPAMSRAA